MDLKQLYFNSKIDMDYLICCSNQLRTHLSCLKWKGHNGDNMQEQI